MTRKDTNFSPTKNTDDGLLKHPANGNNKSQEKSDNIKGGRKSKRNCKPTESQSQNKNKKKNKKNTSRAGLQ